MFRLSDEVIAEIAKLVQIAIVTGTDVVDNLRMIRVHSTDDDNSSLVLTPEYRELSESQIEKLLSEVKAMSNRSSEEEVE
jgi:hypothetical protein|tara:strand:+ start:16757 stop:16996 length:240 start_codon:yes stop_codon:yes gene_type:complete